MKCLKCGKEYWHAGRGCSHDDVCEGEQGGVRVKLKAIKNEHGNYMLNDGQRNIAMAFGEMEKDFIVKRVNEYEDLNFKTEQWRESYHKIREQYVELKAQNREHMNMIKEMQMAIGVAQCLISEYHNFSEEKLEEKQKKIGEVLYKSIVLQEKIEEVD